jgi:hypothetical protein
MRSLIIVCLTLCLGCGSDEAEQSDGPEIPDDATIIVIGDSVMAWNAEEEASIPDVIGEELDRVVYNAAVSGAYITDEIEGEEGMDIREQYVDNAWEWLVLDGGANDFNDECGCTACADILDEIISADGQSGVLPEFVQGVVDQGLRVVVWGYYNVPDSAEYGFAECNELIDDYSERQALLADGNANVWFVDGREAVDSSDLDNYDDDHVHPSPQGSQRIGEAIAEQILAAEQ